MIDLSAEDRELITGGGRDDLPTEADRARIRGRLATRLGLAAGLGAATAGVTVTSAAAATGTSTLAKALAVLAIGTLGALGSAVVVTRGRAAPPVAAASGSALAPSRSAEPLAAPRLAALSAQEPASSASATPDLRASAQEVAALSPPLPVASTSSFAPPRPGRVPASDALAEETRMLREADAATRGGDAPRALALLEEHARRFPRGVLAEERGAERVLALCAAGRSDDARVAAVRFLADRPQSPLAGRVRASCGGSP